jgi:hypothetical protein
MLSLGRFYLLLDGRRRSRILLFLPISVVQERINLGGGGNLVLLSKSHIYSILYGRLR